MNKAADTHIGANVKFIFTLRIFISAGYGCHELISEIALMMEAARTSETLVNFYQTTRCYNPEDSNLQNYNYF
jgi:hypothetical protein